VVIGSNPAAPAKTFVMFSAFFRFVPSGKSSFLSPLGSAKKTPIALHFEGGPAHERGSVLTGRAIDTSVGFLRDNLFGKVLSAD